MTNVPNETFPFATLSDPECPTDFWWGWAIRYPLVAMASPLFPLLTLEQPERWLRMEEAHRGAWIGLCVSHLDFDTTRRLFAADCAERALPIWERASLPEAE